MSNPLFLRENTEVELDGLPYTITTAHRDYFVLTDGNGRLKTMKQATFMSQYSAGNLVTIQPERGVVLKFLNEDELITANMYQKLFDEMGNSGKPYSKDHIEDYVIPYAIKAHGLDENKIPSFSTLGTKRRIWEKNGHCVHSIVRRKKVNVRTSKFDEISLEFAHKVIEDNFLTLCGKNRASTLLAYQDALQGTGLAEIKRATFYGLINKLDEYQVCLAREGATYANNKYRKTYSKYISNFFRQKIEVDAVHLSINILNDDRTKVIATKVILYLAIDIHTRLIVGYHCSLADENKEKAVEHSDGVIQLLKNVVIAKSDRHKNAHYIGVPKAIVCDAGAAFNNGMVKQFLINLNIENHITETGRPWKKPFIERFNRTLRDKFCLGLSNYKSNNASHIRDRDLRRNADPLTKAEFIHDLERFLFEIYQNSPHLGLGRMTPNQKFELVTDTDPALIPANMDLINAFHGSSDTRIYNINTGIQFACGYYMSTELSEMMRDVGSCEVTILYTYSDISTITILHPNSSEFTIVECTDPDIVPGTSLAQSKELRSEQSPSKPSTPFFKPTVGQKKPKTDKHKKNSADSARTGASCTDDLINNSLGGGKAKQGEKYKPQPEDACGKHKDTRGHKPRPNLA